jgi:hypothetical protein
MASALLILWWFAVLQNGEALFFEYRDEASCRIVQQAYARTGLTVTTCQPKRGRAPETSGQSRNAS